MEATMATPARWSNPEGWNRPARVAFAGMSEVNHQDPAQQVVLEGDAEVIPAAAYTEAGQVDPKISGADVVVAGFAKQRYGNEFFSALETTLLFVRPFVGFDDVDIDAATKNGVLVCNMADAIYDDVSTQMMSLTLATDRHVLIDDRWVREGNWARTGKRLPDGMLLHRPATKV